MPQPPAATGGGPERDRQNGPDDGPTLLSDAQWAYLQKRFELTRRERQVADLVCRGLRNDGIAAHLEVRPETVKTHIRSLFRKTGVRSRMHLLLTFVVEANHALKGC